MKIIIIDTGVDISHPILKGMSIEGECIEFKNNKLYSNKKIEDEIGHGTAINGIIAKHNKNVELYNIKIITEKEQFI
ncbi:MAG: S8 family serine peptidase, partial [Clostridium sp.]